MLTIDEILVHFTIARDAYIQLADTVYADDASRNLTNWTFALTTAVNSVIVAGQLTWDETYIDTFAGSL